MFANAFQSGFISVFYSIGSNPLILWDKAVKNGHIRRVIDEEVKSLVLEVSGTNVATTYITCPIKPRASLGIRLPFLVMVVKNLKKYFTFEIQILDDKDMRRRFRVSNFQSTTKVRPFCTTMPIGLSSGWNQIQFNLADFTRRAYGTVYLETVRVQIHANVRIRRIYFSDRLYTEEELPSEYKLFLPASTGKGKVSKKAAEKATAATKPAAAPIKIEEVEHEIPSGAPPTPIEQTRPPPTAQTDESKPEGSMEPAAGDVADVGEVTDDGPAAKEGGEEAEGHVAEAGEEAPQEAAPAEEGGEEHAAEAPAEEAPPAEEPAEAPAEEEAKAEN